MSIVISGGGGGNKGSISIPSKYMFDTIVDRDSYFNTGSQKDELKSFKTVVLIKLPTVKIWSWSGDDIPSSYDNTKWDESTYLIQGPTGQQGAQGVQGEKGEVGPQGPKGDKGDGSDNAKTAETLKTPRKINGVDFDGSKDITIPNGTGGVDKTYVDNELLKKSDTNHTHTKSSITDFPTLSSVALSGSYNDLKDKPTIPVVDVTKSYVDTELGKKSNTSHTHTKLEIGIDKVDNTSDAEKNVLSSTKLTTARKINGVEFDGSKDITIPTGTGSATFLGLTDAPHSYTGEKGKIVRVKADESGLEFVVNVDEVTKSYVDTELGKKANTSHTHNKSEITDFPTLSTVATTGKYSDLTGAPIVDVNKSYVDTELGKKVDKATGKSLILDSEITRLSTVTNYVHPSTHPSSMITGLSTVATSGSYSDLSNKPTIPTVDVNKSYVDTELGKKANTSHVHTISDVTSLQTNLDSKANTSTTYTKTEVDSLVSNKVDKVAGKQLSTEDYSTTDKTKVGKITTTGTGDKFLSDDGVYKVVLGGVSSVNTKTGAVTLSKADINLGNVDNTADKDKPISTLTQTALDTKAPTTHTHTIANTTGLQTSLDGKALTIHTHTIADVTNLQSNLDGKALSSHTHTISNTTGLQSAIDNKEDKSNKGVANGYAGLDSTGKVPSSQLPSYVDDVIEVANFSSLPTTGESGKIYITIDNNKSYRWGGTTYVPIPSGNVDSVNSKTGVVVLGKTDIGLPNVDNTSDANKPISTATQNALNGKANSTHAHAISDVTSLQTSLDAKADKTTSYTKTEIDGKDNLKVDKVTGKSLILDSEITRLAGVTNYVHPTGTNPHGTTKTDVGLGNVDNTSDANKPISTATKSSLDTKVDKVTGKSLIDDVKITKLDGISTGANKVESSTNGNIKIDGVDKTVYTHPTGTNPHGTTKSDVGLSNVDNTNDINKPISTATKSYVDSEMLKTATKGHQHNAYEIVTDSSNRFVTDARIAQWTNIAMFGMTHNTIPETTHLDDCFGMYGSHWAEGTIAKGYPMDGLCTVEISNGNRQTVYKFLSNDYVWTRSQDAKGVIQPWERLPTKYYIDGKVDKVTGKSLISDSEIARLSTVIEYKHPTTHPPSMIATDANNRFVSDSEKTSWSAKVDKVTGKSLIDDTKITKLDGISVGANKVEYSSNGVVKIDGITTTVYYHPTGTNPHGTTKSDVGLNNVDNTSDINKPISTATQNAINTITDKFSTKMLCSTPYPFGSATNIEYGVILPWYKNITKDIPIDIYNNLMYSGTNPLSYFKDLPIVDSGKMALWVRGPFFYYKAGNGKDNSCWTDMTALPEARGVVPGNVQYAAVGYANEEYKANKYETFFKGSLSSTDDLDTVQKPYGVYLGTPSVAMHYPDYVTNCSVVLLGPIQIIIAKNTGYVYIRTHNQFGDYKGVTWTLQPTNPMLDLKQGKTDNNIEAPDKNIVNNINSLRSLVKDVAKSYEISSSEVIEFTTLRGIFYTKSGSTTTGYPSGVTDCSLILGSNMQILVNTLNNDCYIRTKQTGGSWGTWILQPTVAMVNSKSKVSKSYTNGSLYIDGTENRVYTHPDLHPASMITGLSKVATTGDYNNLINCPNIPVMPYVPKAYMYALVKANFNPVEGIMGWENIVFNYNGLITTADNKFFKLPNTGLFEITARIGLDENTTAISYRIYNGDTPVGMLGESVDMKGYGCVVSDAFHVVSMERETTNNWHVRITWDSGGVATVNNTFLKIEQVR